VEHKSTTTGQRTDDPDTHQPPLTPPAGMPSHRAPPFRKNREKRPHTSSRRRTCRSQRREARKPTNTHTEDHITVIGAGLQPNYSPAQLDGHCRRPKHWKEDCKPLILRSVCQPPLRRQRTNRGNKIHPSRQDLRDEKLHQKNPPDFVHTSADASSASTK
jgi:hypothetical protein